MASRTDVLEIYLGDQQQLFNSLDPAPFHQRDLDPAAAEYIVDWAQDAPNDRPLGIVLRLGHCAAPAGDGATVQQSVRDHFQRRAAATRRRLQQMLRMGRYSLVIALAFLALVVVIAESLAGMVAQERYAELIEHSLVIGAWVALWRPLEIFLYGWWPVRAEARLFDRLGQVDVSTVQVPVAAHGGSAEAAR
ncbi:MAG: hypothetical protein NDI84_09005 [Steroidobacteraceae bacterium]|nr:hypothetical protein [Steroidobacteraceae bacterium]